MGAGCTWPGHESLLFKQRKCREAEIHTGIRIVSRRSAASHFSRHCGGNGDVMVEKVKDAGLEKRGFISSAEGNYLGRRSSLGVAEAGAGL
jgi:hypothetical protein